MEISFTYNGVSFADLLTVNNITGRAFGPSSVVTSPKITNMPGRHFIRKSRGARQIVLTVTIKGDNVSDLRDRFDEIARDLDTDEEVPIVFSDEVDRTYYGVMVSDNSFEDIRNFGQGQIMFYCSDPFKYAAETNVVLDDGSNFITNTGTAETYPRFEIDVLQDTTHIDLISATGEYMRIGTPADATETQYEDRTLIFHDTCSTLTGWTTADSVDNGYIDGDIIVEGDRFKCNTVGPAIQPYEWQGPSIKTSLAEPLEDWRMDCEFEILNVGNGTGMIEVYLKDASNNTVAKVGAEDIWRSYDAIQTKFKLGNVNDPNRPQQYYRADYDYGWNNFKGVMRIWSHNQTDTGYRRIRPYFALVYPDGTHDWVRMGDVYIDENNTYGQPITQVQIAMRTWAPAVERAEMYVDDIKVWRLNEAPDDGVNYVARAGDHVTIDHATDLIRINGELAKTEKDFGATFFPLLPGINTIHQYPKGALNTTVYYKSAYK